MSRVVLGLVRTPYSHLPPFPVDCGTCVTSQGPREFREFFLDREPNEMQTAVRSRNSQEEGGPDHMGAVRLCSCECLIGAQGGAMLPRCAAATPCARGPSALPWRGMETSHTVLLTAWC